MDCGLSVSSVQGILRQEYWSGLPFLSPIYAHCIGGERESECESFFTFSSIIGYYKILSIIPCAILWILVGYLFFFFFFCSCIYILIPIKF